MNGLQRYVDAFAGFTPWEGKLPARYIVDFLGALKPKEFLDPWGPDPVFVDSAYVQMRLPQVKFSASGRGLPVRDGQLGTRRSRGTRKFCDDDARSPSWLSGDCALSRVADHRSDAVQVGYGGGSA
jgi:hypothetical protein